MLGKGCPVQDAFLFQLVKEGDEPFQLFFVFEGYGDFAFSFGVTGELHRGLDVVGVVPAQYVVAFGGLEGFFFGGGGGSCLSVGYLFV